MGSPITPYRWGTRQPGRIRDVLLLHQRAHYDRSNPHRNQPFRQEKVTKARDRTLDLAIGEDHERPILRRRNGQRLDRRTAHRWVRSIGKRAGLGAVHPHMLRKHPLPAIEGYLRRKNSALVMGHLELIDQRSWTGQRVRSWPLMKRSIARTESSRQRSTTSALRVRGASSRDGNPCWITRCWTRR